MIIFESQQNCQWLCLPGLKAAYKTSYLEDLAFYWINVVMMMITMIFDHLSIKATCSQNISPRTTSPPLLLKRSWISLSDYQWWTNLVFTWTTLKLTKFTYIKSLPHFSLGRKIMMPEKTGLFKIAYCNNSPNKFCVICFKGEPSRRLKGSLLKGFFESILMGKCQSTFLICWRLPQSWDWHFI